MSHSHSRVGEPSAESTPAARPSDVMRSIVAEAYSVLQKELGCESVEVIWPDAEEPLAVIRDLALEYERRYQQLVFGLVDQCARGRGFAVTTYNMIALPLLRRARFIHFLYF